MKNYGVALTTVDNPYDIFKDFDSWYMFDVDKGYNSCSYLARIFDSIPEEEGTESERVERAINEILKYDILGVYKKVTNKVSS